MGRGTFPAAIGLTVPIQELLYHSFAGAQLCGSVREVVRLT